MRLWFAVPGGVFGDFLFATVSPSRVLTSLPYAVPENMRIQHAQNRKLEINLTSTFSSSSKSAAFNSSHLL